MSSAGPETLTMRELNARIAAMAGHSPEIVDVPDFVAAGMAKFGFLPGAPLSSDQWKMLQRDNVAAEGASGLDAFGIVADPARARWRPNGSAASSRAGGSPPRATA